MRMRIAKSRCGSLFPKMANTVRRTNGRKLLVPLVVLLLSLIFAGVALAYSNVYWQGDLGPGTAATNYKYNYWYYNQMLPDSADAPTGIYFLHTDGSSYGVKNGYGDISINVSSGNYGNGYCWNRSSYQTYFINSCADDS